MSFFRKKSGLEIPPVVRDDSLGSRGSGRSVSPQPPPYRASAASTYNASRDGDKYDNEKYEKRPDLYSGGDVGSSGPAGRGPVPERYANRGGVGDPYARGGNLDTDRAALFSGYNPEKKGAAPGRNRFDETPDNNEPPQFQTQEEEEEEVEGIKQQTRWAKQESVQSTRNALRIAREAEETGRNALLRLGDQSEKLANTERYIDQGKLHAARAEDKTVELKKLNRSIFRPAITFNKDAKRAAQEAKVADRYNEERTNRERAMADVRESHNRLGQAASYEGGELGEEGSRRIRQRQEDRKRYQFEKTASDDELEDELDDNLDDVEQVTKRLKAIALAAGEELDRQNGRIDNIAAKTGKLDTRIGLTTDRLKRIK